MNRIVQGLRWRMNVALDAAQELLNSTKSTDIGDRPDLTLKEKAEKTSVDEYWSEHTVNSKPFRSADQSEAYLKWRANSYPLFTEFMNLYGNHDDEVILDYGCGPGNDLVGFSIYTRAKKIVGVDVSQKALELARDRLALHKVAPERLQLIQAADSESSIQLEDETVDYVHCAGVLQHTSNPQNLLMEFHRVLKPDSSGCVMVYNKQSLWLHLYTAYVRMILENAFPGLTPYEAFSKNVDGVECPLARCYTQQEFVAMCSAAGFQAEYLGGYFSDVELKSFKKYGQAAINDTRLEDEHRDFLKSLVIDEQGYPKYDGKHVGIGGVYNLRKL